MQRLRQWAARRLTGTPATAADARAPLLGYRSAGAGLVLDIDYPGGGLTWLADANLFQRTCREQPETVDLICAAVPIIDGSDGPHAVVADDFDTVDGTMTWWGAMAWAEWLGKTGYAGARDWRLCSAMGCLDAGPCPGGHSGCGELGRLFYAAGGLQARSPITSSPVLRDHFSNLQDGIYWCVTEYRPNPAGAWVFCTADGTQYFGYKERHHHAWAVRAGPVHDTALSGDGRLPPLDLTAPDTEGYRRCREAWPTSADPPSQPARDSTIS
jgi:hypothetical protein